MKGLLLGGLFMLVLLLGMLTAEAGASGSRPVPEANKVLAALS